MTTQIDNLVTSFNEILLQTGNLFDELYTDKTVNLVLPSNNRLATKLSESIKTFDKNLDFVLMQLNDVILFDSKLKQTLIEKEKQKIAIKNEAVKAQPTPQQIQAQQHQQSAQQKQQEQIQQAQRALPTPSQPLQQQTNYGGNEMGSGDSILDDLNEFLSNVPDTGDVGMDENFNENIQQLLMESNDYNGQSNGGFSFNASKSDTQNNGDFNLDIDNNIFNEIDSMLNID